MPEHASDDWLTTATYWSGLHNNPLGMRGWIVFPELGDLALLVIHQPADTSLRCVAINKWPVLTRHQSTIANDHFNGG